MDTVTIPLNTLIMLAVIGGATLLPLLAAGALSLFVVWRHHYWHEAVILKDLREAKEIKTSASPPKENSNVGTV